MTDLAADYAGQPSMVGDDVLHVLVNLQLREVFGVTKPNERFAGGKGHDGLAQVIT